jgi:plasmid stabilization system protein ParE
MPAAAAFAWELPVSGRRIALRQPTGLDETLLLELRGSEPARAIAFANLLACDGTDAATLPVSDLDVLLLLLRQALLGDRLLAETSCHATGCGARVDVAFSIDAFLAHHRPQSPRLRAWQVTHIAEQAGWFTLRAAGADAAAVRFRLPTAGDERDVVGQADAAAALMRRCIAPLPVPAAARRAAEAVMAALAPPLTGPLAGTCPDCGADVPIGFDPRRYVLAELRARARFIAEEVDTLAVRYHWTERAILNLPGPRRTAYAELARRAA